MANHITFLKSYCVFFTLIDLSHYSAHKSINYQKMNDL